MDTQPEVREAMLERLERRALRSALGFRETPQPAPDPDRRTFFHEDLGPMAQHQPRHFLAGQRLAGARCRELADAPFLARRASIAHGTTLAARLGARAYRGTKVHQRLRISLHALAGQEAFGERP